jgi:hypothetical protein
LRPGANHKNKLRTSLYATGPTAPVRIGGGARLSPSIRSRSSVSPTPEERRYLGELAAWLKEETGYQWIQGTRPQTLAFALTDSPAGLAA